MIWPGLRVCFCVAPKRFRRRLAKALLTTVWMTPPLNAALVSDWIIHGQTDDVLATKRAEARRRRLAADAILPDWRLSGPDASYFIWLALPPPWTGRAFEDAARQAGVRIFASEKFVVGGAPPPAAARISLSGPETLDRLRDGLSTLAAILNHQYPALEGIV